MNEFIGAWCDVHNLFHVCAYAGSVAKRCSCCGQPMDKRIPADVARRVGLPEYTGKLDCMVCRPFGPGATCCDN